MEIEDVVGAGLDEWELLVRFFAGRLAGAGTGAGRVATAGAQVCEYRGADSRRGIFSSLGVSP